MIKVTTIFSQDGVLITAGDGVRPYVDVELYLPSSDVSCSLPDLPYETNYCELGLDGHTVESSGLLCGGGGVYGAEHTCLKWNPYNGTWDHWLTLDVQRIGHSSWTPSTDIGTYLIGGVDVLEDVWEARNSTTLIKPDGTQEPGFKLKYDTM